MFYLSTCKKKKREYYFFSYFEYAWVTAILYNRFNNWIVDVIWNRVAVRIYCKFKITYNIRKERIQNSFWISLSMPTILEKKVFRICTVLMSLSTISSSSIKINFSLDTILSDKNGLMNFQKVFLSIHFFSSRLL